MRRLANSDLASLTTRPYVEPMSTGLSKRAKLICVDWGTTNLRAYAIGEDGSVIDEAQSNAGLRSNRGNYSDCLTTMIGSWLKQDSPINILLSGMIGAPTGWQEVPHVAAPVALPQLAAKAIPVTQLHGHTVWIVPGVKGTGISGLPDVMRGEEIQFFGAQRLCVDRHAGQPDIWCFPGTHNKWIASGENIDHFSTSMVGEIFELLRQHSLLAQSLEQNVSANQPGFLRGLETGRKAGGLLHHLFSVRTLDLTGAQEKSDGLEYLSGIIIGHDIGAQLRKPSHYVGVVASSPLARKYQIALEALGHSSIIIESQAATINGALAINEHLLAASEQPGV